MNDSTGARARNDQGTGRPDTKMSRSDDGRKRSWFGTGSRARRRVQGKASTRRRQRDRVAATEGH